MEVLFKNVNNERVLKMIKDNLSKDLVWSVVRGFLGMLDKKKDWVFIRRWDKKFNYIWFWKDFCLICLSFFFLGGFFFYFIFLGKRLG